MGQNYLKLKHSSHTSAVGFAQKLVRRFKSFLTQMIPQPQLQSIEVLSKARTSQHVKQKNKQFGHYWPY